MSGQYRLITCQQAKFDELVNNAGDDGWSVEQILLQGNHYSVLMHKWSGDDNVEISESGELFEAQFVLEQRLEIVEGALALKIKKDEIDPPKDEPVPSTE